MSCALIILYLFCILRLPLTYLYLHTYTKRNRDLYQFRCLSLDFPASKWSNLHAEKWIIGSQTPVATHRCFRRCRWWPLGTICSRSSILSASSRSRSKSMSTSSCRSQGESSPYGHCLWIINHISGYDLRYPNKIKMSPTFQKENVCRSDYIYHFELDYVIIYNKKI